MKIADKIRVTFLLITIAVTGIAAPIFFQTAKDHLKSEISEHLKTTLHSRASHIQTFLKTYREASHQFSQSIIIEKFLSTQATDEAYPHYFKDSLRRLMGIRQVVKEVREVFVLNSKGAVVLSSEEEDIGRKRSKDDYLLGDVTEGVFVRASQEEKRHYMVFSFPVFSRDKGAFLGAVVEKISMEEINRILQERTGLGKTGEMYLLNEAGYVITPSRFKKDSILKLRVVTENTERYFKDLKELYRSPQKTEPILYPDYRGVKVLGAYEYLPEMFWGLFAEIDEAEVFASLAQIKSFFILAVFFILVGTWFIGSFVSRIISKPIRELHRGVEIIGQGNLGHKVATKKNDEIGRLSRAFDKMTEDLKKRTTSIDSLSREIFDQKKIEGKLKESELKLVEIIDFQPDPMLAIDLEGRVIAWNRAMEEMTGVTAEDMLGRRNYEYALPFYQERRPILVDMVLQQDQNLEAKYFFITKEKDLLVAETDKPFVKGQRRVLWAKAAPIYDAGGEIVGAIETIRDMTERKRTEDILRENELKYRALFESSPDAIMLSDKTGIFDCNWSTLRIFGFISKDEVVGRHPGGPQLSPLKQPDGSDSFENANVHTMKAVREGWNFFEWMHKRADGTLFSTEVTLNRFELEGRNVLQIIIRDITGRKKAGEERKRLEEQLQQAQKMEAVGTLAGGIAHDFNNLIMGIQGWTELILMDTDPDHPHFERLKEIESIAKRTAGLTKQLLGFGRRGKYDVKPIDLNDLVMKSSQMFGRTRKEITISAEYQKNIWTVEANEGQIEQVLLNLYINGWEAIKGEGKFYLKTENIVIDKDYAKPFKIKPGRYVKISVTDTGVGMDKKTREKIFDPFFTTKDMGGGTGLGLASAYGIVKNHEGFINVYSEKDKGATFNIYLPVSEARAIISEKFIRKEDFLKGDETVLLVDDEEMIIKVGEKILKSLGYEVFLAQSGKETIEIYKKHRDEIDLVILDMVMPEMGGGKTYDRLKKIDPDIKVLLSSGYSINGEADKIMKRGCNGFIQKPFNINQLSHEIRRVLEKKRR